MEKGKRGNGARDLKSERGLSLVELMMVVAIMPILFFSLYSLIATSGVIFRTNDVYSQLNQNSMQTLRYIAREVGQSSSDGVRLIINGGGNNDSVRFQIPVDWDADGDIVQINTNDTVEWGAYDDVGAIPQDPNNPRADLLGRWIQYAVIQDPTNANNNQLVRDVLDVNLLSFPNLRRIVANGVVVPNGFTITQNQNSLTMTITLTADDAVGQDGVARTVQATFTNSTTLRN
jgi:prepilin-type N-terminal cleavage/methylation domain-containing protein